MPQAISEKENEFDKLLNWLDEDRESSAKVYENIRLRLTKIFYSRGCRDAEELTDETIDRVIKKIDHLQENYEGDPRLYFYGVAKRVFLEFTRKPKEKELPEHIEFSENETEEKEKQDECLTSCLEKITSNNRDFILRYYKGDKGKKIKRRQRMMDEMNITADNLRIRAYRIRIKLQECVFECMGIKK